MIKRLLEKQILKALEPQKVVIVYGARQVGKTTLLKKILKALKQPHIFINADIKNNRSIIESQDLDRFKTLIGDKKLLIIDEAQRIENIGLNLKIMVDEIPDIKILVTGSSSFELANKIHEPLTGRNKTFTLYPISVGELKSEWSDFELEQKIEDFLTYGLYPDSLNKTTLMDKRKYLERIANDYLYKDILRLQDIRKETKIDNLLKLVSFQVGSELSLSELSKTLGIDIKTVGRYLDLLEKSFIIFSLSGFSRNLRKEVTKSYKYYFYDLGIRNTIIDNFKPISDRNDIGALWENFVIVERLKHLKYSNVFNKRYFWRTYTGAEIDYIEDRQTQLFGYEIKWGDNKAKIPKTWKESYNASWQLINKKNWLKFVS